MRNSPYEDDEGVPSPQLVAAWLVLGCLAPERVPVWAAHWLANGQDGTALRDLAGMSGKDPHEVRDVLPAALREAGVEVADPVDVEQVRGDRKRAWVSMVYRDIARLCLESRASPRWVVDKVTEIVADNNYGDVVTEPPLGRLFGMDDEWGAGWGRTDVALENDVRAACREQMADGGYGR